MAQTFGIGISQTFNEKQDIRTTTQYYKDLKVDIARHDIINNNYSLPF